MLTITLITTLLQVFWKIILDFQFIVKDIVEGQLSTICVKDLVRRSIKEVEFSDYMCAVNVACEVDSFDSVFLCPAFISVVYNLYKICTA